MATSTANALCATCGKKGSFRCEGCLQTFCYNHLTNHRALLHKQLDEIENDRDQFRHKLSEQTDNPNKRSIIQEIDKWEQDSIKIIQQTANECRQILTEETNKCIVEIEDKLNKLTNEIKQFREEEEFNETELTESKNKLTQLIEELDKPPCISVKTLDEPLVNKIFVSKGYGSLNIPRNARWTQNGVTIAGGNGYGAGNNQLYNPRDLYVDDNRGIFIADYRNHRIVQWSVNATSGQVIVGGNGAGSRTDQLNSPVGVIVDKGTDCLMIADHGNRRVMRWSLRNGTTNGEIVLDNIYCHGLAMDDEGYLYVSDVEKHEVRKYRIGEKDGNLVAGGNGAGDRLNQLSKPYYIFVDQEHSVYVSDYNNARVTQWIRGATEGIVVAGGQGQGNAANQLKHPYGIFVDLFGTTYIAEAGNNRISCWRKGMTQGEIIVGTNNGGAAPNQFNFPVNLSFNQHGNLYVVDYRNHRIQRFLLERN